MSCIKNWLGRLLNVMHDVGRGVLRGHAGVHKPDQVRDGVIAKNQLHFSLIALEAMDGVELPGQLSRQVAMTVAPEGNSQATA